MNDDTLTLDAIAEVAPNGHYFGAQHTLARYDTAFYAPMVSDWRNYETWREAGALDAARRANAIWKKLLADYQPPPLDPATREELDAYVIGRKAQGGVVMS
jgi:trimethylamine--corrinoid protein Co-methyltransferase